MTSDPGLGVRSLALALGLVAVLGACGGPAAPAPSVPSSSDAAPIAPALTVPGSHQLVLVMTVERGSQIYTCTHGTWALTAPAAVLTSPSTDVLHTAGPRWIATSDGSAVSAAQVNAVPVAGAVPELLLRATGHDGNGVLSSVDYVQRLATHGGQAPATGCADAEQRAVGYTAEYRFYAPGP